jgi:hypothetical protein
MADLVSGNLKEDKNTHSTQLLHSGGPQRQPAQLVVSIRHIADIRRAESGVPSCTFGGQQAQRATFRGMTVTTGCAVLLIWRKIADYTQNPRIGGRLAGVVGVIA